MHPDTGTYQYLTPFIWRKLLVATVNFIFPYVSLRYMNSAISMLTIVLAHLLPGKRVL